MKTNHRGEHPACTEKGIEQGCALPRRTDRAVLQQSLPILGLGQRHHSTAETVKLKDEMGIGSNGLQRMRGTFDLAVQPQISTNGGTCDGNGNNNPDYPPHWPRL